MTLNRAAAALCLIIGLCLPGVIARAGESVEGKNNRLSLEGTFWGRYSYLLEDLSEENASIDRNGFAIDRVYLTMSSQLGEKHIGRIRLEAENQNDGASRVFLKTAEVVVSDPLGLKASKLRFGQTEGIASVWYEKPWGYRIVSRTVPDRYLGISTTYLCAGLTKSWLGGLVETDLVVANRAPFNQDVASGAANPRVWATGGTVYSVATGTANPKHKIFGGRAYVTPFREGPAKGFGVGGYAQIASGGPDDLELKSSEKRTLWFGAHAFYMSEKLNGGVQYDLRARKTPTFEIAHVDGMPDTTMTLKEHSSDVISILGRFYVTDRIELFGRYDIVDYDTDAEGLEVAARAAERLLAALRPSENVLMLGVSRACTKTLRGVLDLSLRSISEDIYLVSREVSPGQAPKLTRSKSGSDDEITVSLRLEARL